MFHRLAKERCWKHLVDIFSLPENVSYTGVVSHPHRIIAVLLLPYLPSLCATSYFTRKQSRLRPYNNIYIQQQYYDVYSRIPARYIFGQWGVWYILLSYYVRDLRSDATCAPVRVTEFSGNFPQQVSATTRSNYSATHPPHQQHSSHLVSSSNIPLLIIIYSSSSSGRYFVKNHFFVVVCLCVVRSRSSIFRSLRAVGYTSPTGRLYYRCRENDRKIGTAVHI